MNLLRTKSKLFIMMFGLTCALLLIWTLVFMTQYSNIHVVFEISGGQVEIGAESTFEVGTKTLTNQYLSGYLDDAFKVSPVTETFDEAKVIIYDFQNKMNAFNNYILATLVVGLVMFAVLLIFSNNSRRVYYKSNLIAGCIASGVVAVMAIIGVVFAITLISNFNAHANLYKITSVMMDVDIGAKVKESALSFEEFVNTYAPNVNTLTLVLVMIYFIVIIVSACFVALHTVFKYKATEQARIEIIERARVARV